jgi:hypothetical protein
MVNEAGPAGLLHRVEAARLLGSHTFRRNVTQTPAGARIIRPAGGP